MQNNKFLLYLWCIIFGISPFISFGQSVTSSAKKFNVFIKGNTTLISNESEGPIAVGGNLITNQYQISFDKSNGIYFVNGASIALAVKGGVILNNGSLTINGGNYIKIGNCNSPTILKTWYRDNNGAASTIRITEGSKSYSATPNILLNSNAKSFGETEVSDSNNPVCQNVFGNGASQINMEAAFADFSLKSASLSSLADNLPILDQNGKTIIGAEMGPYTDPNKFINNSVIKVDSNKVNVLTVSAKVWNSLGNINISDVPNGPSNGFEPVPNTNFALIINITDLASFNQKLNFPGFGGLSDNKASYVIYNFVDATGDLKIGGNTQIVGTLFAPNANLIKENNGNINGQVIANEFVHKKDEIHYWPFQPKILDDNSIDVTTSSKCEKNAPWLQYVVTPSFDASGQTIKVEWLNAADEIVKTETNLPLSGRLLYPGAAVNADSEGIAWPGWRKVGMVWQRIADTNASIRELGAKVRITLNPTKTVDIFYPISSQTCKTEPPTEIALPVKLTSFEVVKMECKVKMNWSTSEAVNFSKFEIERSSDAIEFNAIGEVGYVPSHSIYQFVDSRIGTENVPVGKQYYRLKQIDNDGTYEYSKIKAVSDVGCVTSVSVNIFPNPAINELEIVSKSNLKLVEIMSLSGKVIYNKLLSNLNIKILKVSLSQSDAGLYLLKIVNQEGVTVSRFMKQ